MKKLFSITGTDLGTVLSAGGIATCIIGATMWPSPYGVLGTAIGTGLASIASWWGFILDIEAKRSRLYSYGPFTVLVTGFYFGVATHNVTLGFLAAVVAAFVVIALLVRVLTRK
jgi:hypothetical protein